MACSGKAQIEVVARRCGVEIFSEQPLKLPRRQIGHSGDIGLCQRFFQIVFHGLHDGQQLWMTDSQP